MEKKIWFTSDTHFGHNKEFLYGPRGFTSIGQHDWEIIRNWNSVVGPDDEVYHLGDMMLVNNEHGMHCIRMLNGRIHLILGNHDTQSRHVCYEECPNICEIVFATQIRYKKNYFYCSHYPTITANYDDQKPWSMHLINLFGHTHQKEKFYNDNPYMYNVGLDAHNNYPVEINEIIADIKTKKETLDRQ